MTQSAENDAPPRRDRFGWPHLRAGEPEKRYDLGDSLARTHGVWVVPVVCGRPNVPTTLTTKRAERVRCPECQTRPIPPAKP